MLHLLARYPLLDSPRTLSALAAATAFVASLLLDNQDASAGTAMHGNLRR